MRLFATLLVPIFAFATPAATAQVVIQGESPARLCYEHAVAERDDRSALADCNEALETVEVRRNRAATHVNRGIILLHAGRSEEALADFNEAEMIGSVRLGDLALNRSSALIRLGRYRDAVTQTEIAIAEGGFNAANAWFNRGVALEELGDLPGAYDAYQQAATLRPNWRLPQFELRRFGDVSPS